MKQIVKHNFLISAYYINLKATCLTVKILLQRTDADFTYGKISLS